MANLSQDTHAHRQCFNSHILDQTWVDYDGDWCKACVWPVVTPDVSLDLIFLH